MICDLCHVICKDFCPRCGSAKHLRAVNDGEPALLIVLTTMQAMLVEPLLQESGIPYFKKGEVGAALTARWGTMRELYHFYVPCGELDHCRRQIAEVFGTDDTIMKLLHEFDT